MTTDLNTTATADTNIENSQLLFDALQKRFGEDGELNVNEPMSLHTTFKVGGEADFLIEPHDQNGIADAIKIATSHCADWRVMGCGSNILVADTGVRGVVILLGDRFSNIQVMGEEIHAQAGATNKDVVDIACAASLGGYEFASGIPGSIGGAAIMNAGAYDGEFKDVCTGVKCLTPEGNIVEVSAKDADWGYRHSMMSERGYVVLEACLKLSPTPREQIQAKMDDLQERRESKQPLEMASAGSTFKRPEGYFAGKLIDEAGMRGHTVGGAQVSTKHCGFVVNTGGASARDVLGVIRDVQEAVKQNAGVELQTEVRMWGFE